MNVKNNFRQTRLKYRALSDVRSLRSESVRVRRRVCNHARVKRT